MLKGLLHLPQRERERSRDITTRSATKYCRAITARCTHHGMLFLHEARSRALSADNILRHVVVRCGLLASSAAGAPAAYTI